jgi:hypothetical protein
VVVVGGDLQARAPVELAAEGRVGPFLEEELGHAPVPKLAGHVERGAGGLAALLKDVWGAGERGVCVGVFKYTIYDPKDS